MVLDPQTLVTINVLTTRRNLAVRRLADTGSGEISKQLQTFIAGADARVKALGARLVAMPGRPGAVVAHVFLPLVTD